MLKRDPDPARKGSVPFHAPGGRATDAGNALDLVPRQQSIVPAPHVRRSLVGRGHDGPPSRRSASASSTSARRRASCAASTGSRPSQVAKTAFSAKLAVGSPEFALRGADNKLATILAVGLQRFNYILGDRIQTLDARAIINAVCAMYEELLREGGEQQRAAAWLDLGLTDLAMLRPKPGRS